MLAVGVLQAEARKIEPEFGMRNAPIMINNILYIWTNIVWVAVYFVADRVQVINDAIEEVEREFLAAAKHKKLSAAQQRQQAYKQATPEVNVHGTAYFKFERMVKLAEKIMLWHKHGGTGRSAEEAHFHTPGKFLSAQEIAAIHEASGCKDQTQPPPVDECEKDMYRKVDGTCNNLKRTALGASSTAFRRLIPSRYEDGVSRPIGFLQSQYSPAFPNGPFASPKPSPRVVINNILIDKDIEDYKHTLLLMQFGQFVAHDIALLNANQTCPDTCIINEEFEGKCYPFVVPVKPDNVMMTMPRSSNCADFPRSFGACPREDEYTDGMPPRQQLNGASHFLDGSTIYGSSERILDLVRDQEDPALLKVGAPAKAGQELL